MRQTCIPNSFFERYGALSFPLECNCNSKNLDKDLSLFFNFIYLEMLDSFKELRLNYQDTYQSGLILWNNENITIEGKLLFLEKIGQKGKLLYLRHFK